MGGGEGKAGKDGKKKWGKMKEMWRDVKKKAGETGGKKRGKNV